MKYWKNGFYLEQSEQNDRYEVTDEKWQELLNEQSNGKEIYTDENGEPKIRDRRIDEKQLIQNEILELKEWFDVYYTQHEQKYRRLIELEKLTDEGNNPKESLIQLYNEAEIKRKRIQELESKI